MAKTNPNPAQTQNCSAPVIGPEKPLARAHKPNVPQNRGIFKTKLSDLLDDGDLEQAVTTIREAMTATKSHWDGVAKRMVEEPDHKVRLEAAGKVLAYKEGMPVQRQVVVQESFESLRDAIMAAEHSDEAKRFIEAEFHLLDNGTAPHQQSKTDR